MRTLLSICASQASDLGMKASCPCWSAAVTQSAEASCKDEGMTLSSSEYLATAIGTAIGGGGDHQYEATSTSQYGNVIEQWASNGK